MSARIFSHLHKKWSRIQDRSFGNGKQMTLPLELYRPIIEHVELRNDLYSLLFVSRFCGLEAERVLYHTVVLKHLENSSPHRLSNFLDQIPLCDRIALHIRNLTITDFPRARLNSLQQTLQQMCNLRNLTLMSPRHCVLSFTGCSFQLHTLFMRGIMTSDSAFLASQKELTELDIPIFRETAFSSDAFPKMLILSASFPGADQFAHSRPLRALRFTTIPPFGVRQQSVRSLRLPYREPPEDFSATLEGFPTLRYLCIDVYKVVWDNLVQSLQTVFPLLSHLDYLEKLHLYITGYADQLSSEKRDAMVGHCFGALKNLQVLGIEYHTLSTPGRMEWVRGAKTYSYIQYPRYEDEWKDSRWS